MTKPGLALPPLLLVFVCLVYLAAPARAGDGGWKPVEPAHLALSAPTVEKGADAEALFWEVRVEKELEGAVLAHYIRIKIFSERGRESQSAVELPFLSGSKIKDVAGRTIKPDGTIIDLKPEAVIDKMIARAGRFKLQAKSFTLPGVEPGAIIEYRWREVRRSAFYLRLHFQRDIPIQVVKYFIKPSEPHPYVMRAKAYNLKEPSFQPERDGFRSTTVTNVPAFRSESQMPPENEVRSWMLIYYSSSYAPINFWDEYGKQIYEETRSRMKANDEVRKAAVEVIGGAIAPEQKLERIFEFCRTRIKNVSDDASGLTQDQIARLKTNKSPADTLRRGVGSGYDINLLFAGLAAAAGFDARYAAVADRSDVFFDRDFANDYFLTSYDIAVRVGDEWRFFDPGSTYVPYGMLRWQEEGNAALISDPVSPRFVRTPLSPPEKSQKKCAATFRLSENGDLEGDVRIEYSGHLAIGQKESYDQDSPAEREKTVREWVRERISTAELSSIKLEHLTDQAKPFVLSYHVRLPGYAQRTGKRLILQPAFFQHGLQPVFSASERQHPVYFHYPWSEEDAVTIELPAGFDPDQIEAPPSFRAENVSQYGVRILFDQSRRAIIYQRSFYFGANGNLLFPLRGSGVNVQTVYRQLKLLFDMLHERDSHTITLKQIAPASK